MTTDRHCAAGQDCRAWDPTAGPLDDHGQPTGTPAPDPVHTLCYTCLIAAEHAIRRLPWDWLDLEQQLPPSLGVWGDGGSKATGTHPAPISTTVEALQAAIHHTATAWEEVIRDYANLSEVVTRRPIPIRQEWVATVDGVIAPAQRPMGAEHPSMRLVRYRPGPIEVVRAVRVLGPRLGMLSDVDPVELANYPLDILVGPLYRPGKEPDERWETMRRFRGVSYATVPGWQGVLDLATLHRRAVSVLGLASPVKRLPGVCSCGREQLQQDPPRWPGHEQPVYCGAGCGFWEPYDDWLKHARNWGHAA